MVINYKPHREQEPPFTNVWYQIGSFLLINFTIDKTKYLDVNV